MKSQKKIEYFKLPLFLPGLPIFYFLHELTKNYTYDITLTACVLIVKYLAICFILFYTLNLLFKNKIKSAILAFLLVFWYIFFGYILNLSIDIFGTTFFLNRLKFFIPFSVVSLCLIAIYIKSTKLKLIKPFSYLNYLTVLLLTIELINFTFVYFQTSKRIKSVNHYSSYVESSTNKPDIFLIVADEYAGKKQLFDIFDFDNSKFETLLKKKGFFMPNNSSSNYNQTIYSFASMLSMDYIQITYSEKMNHRDIQYCRSILNKNNVGLIFSKAGYTIHNYTPFQFQGNKNPIYHYYFPPKQELLTFQTFYSRIKREIGYHFPKIFKTSKKPDLEYLNNNNSIIIDSTLECINKNSSPKFVFSHLQMPHFPYFFDSTGNPNKNASVAHSDFSKTKKEYIGYLQYTNKILDSLISKIIDSSTNPPIIILISDHGFRNDEYKFQNEHTFNNLCGIYLPNKKYDDFPQNMSLVNLFRIVLNTNYGQNFKLLKDSTVYIAR